MAQAENCKYHIDRKVAISCHTMVRGLWGSIDCIIYTSAAVEQVKSSNQHQNLKHTAYVKKRHMKARLDLHVLDRFAE